MAEVTGLEGIAYASNKKGLKAAYSAFRNNEPDAETVLLQLVWEFACKKAVSKLFTVNEVAKTPEDTAQEVSLYVWSKLAGLKAGPSGFYSWLNRICFTQGSAAYNSAKKIADSRVPLMMPSEDGSGALEDNPLMEVSNYKTPARSIPESVEGIDRLICDYIREGLDYKEIGLTLRMTEDNVKVRVKRLRDKIEKMESSNC